MHAEDDLEKGRIRPTNHETTSDPCFFGRAVFTEDTLGPAPLHFQNKIHICRSIILKIQLGTCTTAIGFSNLMRTLLCGTLSKDMNFFAHWNLHNNWWEHNSICQNLPVNSPSPSHVYDSNDHRFAVVVALDPAHARTARNACVWLIGRRGENHVGHNPLPATPSTSHSHVWFAENLAT